MCGRYTLHVNAERIARAIKASIPPDYAPDYNIGPGRPSLALSAAGYHEGRAEMLHWGLRTPQNFHINARLETADTSPRFRESWAEHRCLLPANGFYEWYADGITKQPYYFYPRSGELTCFAGLCFPASRETEAASFVVLTTEARPPVQAIHHRMPVILDADHWKAWLTGRLSRREVDAAAARAVSEASWECHAVSSRVNSVRHQDSELIRPAGGAAGDQLSLF
jgi:putative SOS response-associated peptidase YedK